MMQKLIVNQAFDNMGLTFKQMLATLVDGITRHSPKGIWFKERAEEVGFEHAISKRDSGDPIAEHADRKTLTALESSSSRP